MKPFLSIIFLCLAGQAFGQNFVLPDGEYMDTTSNQNEKCKNYNAYFYSVGGKYPENSSSLLKEVQTFLQQKPENYSGSGYISFRFTVDCEGKLMQKIQVLQTDEKYTSTHFDKSMVNELFAFLKTLNKWRIAKTKDAEAFSYKAFITFKIQNGKVINIIP
jgi:hypothetical protein